MGQGNFVNRPFTNAIYPAPPLSNMSDYTRKQYTGLIPFTVIDRELISNAPETRGNEVNRAPDPDIWYIRRGVTWEPSTIFRDRMEWVELETGYRGNMWIKLKSLTDGTKYDMAANQMDVLVSNNIAIIDRVIDTDWTFTKQGSTIYLIPYIPG